MGDADTDQYVPLAPFYDLEFGENQDDIPFFLNLVRRTGGPVLEVGAGTGRVALPLAQAGHSVVALDRSPAMLSRLRPKLRGALARRIRPVLGDMRDFHLDERFPLALVADNTFAWLLEKPDQERALVGLREHLVPGGLLVLVLQNPIACCWTRRRARSCWCGRQRVRGRAKYTATRVDWAAQTLRVRMWYDVGAPDLALRRHATQLTLRWFYQPELELLLERSGFEVESWYGSYELEPYSGDAPLLIAVATKA